MKYDIDVLTQEPHEMNYTTRDLKNQSETDMTDHW